MKVIGKSRQFWLIIAAFAVIYVIWGSTYMFIAICLKYIPPFLLSGIRYILAAALLYGVYRLSSNARPKKLTSHQLLNSIIAGILFLVIGSGGAAWSLQYLDSGLVALLISAQPLVLLVMLWIADKKPLPRMSWIGVAMGIIGVYMLVSQDQIIGERAEAMGFVVIFCCMISWGYASILISRYPMPHSFVVNTSIQMIVGGLMMLVIGLLFEGGAHFDWAAVPVEIYLALAYLIIFGAALAFSAFNFLLRNVSPEKVSTSTYVNPVIAMFLGWWFLNEEISGQSLVAAVILLTGVYFINSTKKTLK